MSTPTDRRSQQRLATRQSISNAATRLFLERGFEQVTVDEIAAAAEVGRMTVFNHFPRKEDMFFDREEEALEVLRDSLRHRAPEVSPIETLRRLAHALVAQKSRYVEFSGASQAFVQAIKKSETLRARTRAIRDEVAQVVASEMAQSVGRPAEDPDARLAAALLLASWGEALVQGHRVYAHKRSAKAASAAFLEVVDKGSAGAACAMAQAPYA